MPIEEILMKIHRCAFLIKDNELLEKYGIGMIEGFDSGPVYNQKNLQTKTTSYKRKVNTNFHNDKMPKTGSHCICLSVILIVYF